MNQKAMTAFVKGPLSKIIIENILKNLELASDQPFSTKITLLIKVQEKIEGKILNSSINVLKQRILPKGLKEAKSSPVLNSLVEKIKSADGPNKNHYLEIINGIKNNGEIYFPQKELGLGMVDKNWHTALVNNFNNFLRARDFKCVLKNTGEARTFALYSTEQPEKVT